MSDHRATSPISVPQQRRPSLASMSMSLGSQPGAANPANSPMSASAGRQPRRLSITTLGLAGSPTQTSPFGAGAGASAGANGHGNGNNANANANANGNGRHVRGGSLSSSAGSTGEDLISEEGEASAGTTPSALARRMSFGAQALRDVRRGSVNDERSNWSESLRTRANRAPSISNVLSGSPTQNQSQGSNSRQLEQHRAASIAHMEMEPPVREIPKQPKHNKPDFFQEKILRGDFMD